MAEGFLRSLPNGFPLEKRNGIGSPMPS